MAFSWTNAANLASAGAQLYQAFAGQKESGASRDASRAANRAGDLASSAADPTSSRFRNLAALYDEANRRSAVEQIDRIQRQSARAKARGDVGFAVNPERRDEARYKALADLFVQSKERARQEARNTLLGASGGVAQAAGALPVGTSERREGANFDRTITGLSSIGPFVEILSGLLKPQQGTGGAADPNAPRGTPGGPVGYERRPTVIGYGG